MGLGRDNCRESCFWAVIRDNQILQNIKINVRNQSISQKTFLLVISQMPEGILVISQALKVDLVS